MGRLNRQPVGHQSDRLHQWLNLHGSLYADRQRVGDGRLQLLIVNFGAMASNSDSITLGAGFDARATPGISTGINANPPAPEVRNSASDIAWCERFFQTSYDNGTAPAAATSLA